MKRGAHDVKGRPVGPDDFPMVVTAIASQRDLTLIFTATQTFAIHHPHWHVRLRRWLRS